MSEEQGPTEERIREALKYQPKSQYSIPASPPVDDRAEMETLLRAIYPNDPWMRGRNTKDHAAMVQRILTHLRAEKAAARKEGFHAGREDMAKEGWPICELEAAEAAVLERARNSIRNDHEFVQAGFNAWKNSAIRRIDALISPTSLSALAERDARVRNEALEEAAAAFVQAESNMWIINAIRALKSGSPPK